MGEKGHKGIRKGLPQDLHRPPHPFSGYSVLPEVVQGMLRLTWHSPTSQGTFLGCLSSLLGPASSHLPSASTRNL